MKYLSLSEAIENFIARMGGSGWIAQGMLKSWLGRAKRLETMAGNEEETLP